MRTLTPETATHISFGFSWATAQVELTTLIGQAERALGPTHCLVPNLVGKTLVDSKRLLLAGHCKVGKIKYATSKLRRKNHVIQQGHRPSTTLSGGSSVALLVSSRLIRRRRSSLELPLLRGVGGLHLTPRARATHWLAAIAASPRPIVISVILPS